MNEIAHLIARPWLMNERMATILYQQYLSGRLSLSSLKEKSNQKAEAKAAATIAGMRGSYIGTAVWSTVMVRHASGKNVAIMPVLGTLTKRGELCSYGMRDYMKEIDALNANEEISAIVMDMEGPGGTVDGLNEFGMTVKNSAKPVVSFGDLMVASADYWIASQTKHIIGNKNNPTEFGSIGVFCVHEYWGKFIQENIGEVRIIRAPQSKDKILDNSLEPLPKEVEAEMIADLKIAAGNFITAVKTGRGAALKESEKVWGTGKMYKTGECLEIGLIDAEGTLMDAINKAAELASSSTPGQANKNARAQVAPKQIQKTKSMNTKEVARKVSSFFGKKKASAKPAAAEPAADESTVPMWTEEMVFNTDGSGDGAFCLHADTEGIERKFETKLDNNKGNEPPTDPAITEDDNWSVVADDSSATATAEDDQPEANTTIAKMNAALKKSNEEKKTLKAEIVSLQAEVKAFKAEKAANEKKPAAKATTVVAKSDKTDARDKKDPAKMSSWEKKAYNKVGHLEE